MIFLHLLRQILFQLNELINLFTLLQTRFITNMPSFIHTLHEYVVLLVQYSIVIGVIALIPVPLFTFLGGDTLSQTQYSPLFEYFNHYPISTDSILQNTYTNIYIGKQKEKIKPWDIDNAILWANALAYGLSEENVPVVQRVISSGKVNKQSSLLFIHKEISEQAVMVPKQVQTLFLDLHDKLLDSISIDSLNEGARQWIILAFNADKKTIKKQLKRYISQNPDDNFVLITQLPFDMVKTTLKVQLPQFNIKQAKRVISQAFKISEQQAEILLIQNQKSLWSLNHHNTQNQQFTLKSLLGKNYRLLTDVSQNQEAILLKLCQNGNSKTQKKKVDLSNFGVIVKDNKYRWQNSQAKLNYMIQKITLCQGAKWIDFQQQLSFENVKSNDQKQVQEIIKVDTIQMKESSKQVLQKQQDDTNTETQKQQQIKTTIENAEL